MTEKKQNTALPTELLALVGGTSHRETPVAAEADHSQETAPAASASPRTWPHPFCTSIQDSAQSAALTIGLARCIDASATPATIIRTYCISQQTSASGSAYTNHSSCRNARQNGDDQVSPSDIVFTLPPICFRGPVASDSASALPITYPGSGC